MYRLISHPEMHGEEPQREGYNPRGQAGCDARSEFSAGRAMPYPAASLKIAPSYPNLSEYGLKYLSSRVKWP